MKRKSIMLVIVAILTCSLIACGGNKEDYFDELQEEFEIDDEDVNDILEALDESQEKKESNINEQEKIELVEASDRIKNASLEDGLVQVGKVVLENDGSLSLREVIEKLKTEYGEITVKTVYSKEVTEDSILENDENLSVYIDNGNCICNCWIKNISEERMSNMMDSPVINISSGGAPEVLNFFYSGNICAGTYDMYFSFGDEYKDAYEERLEDYPAMKYSDWDKWLSSISNRYTSINYEHKDEYEIRVIYKNFKIDNLSKYSIFRFELDEATGTFNICNVLTSVIDTSKVYNTVGSIATLEYANEDELLLIKEKSIKEMISYGSANDTAEFVGWYISTAGWMDCAHAVFLTDTGKAVDIALTLSVTGNADITPAYCDFECEYDSIEELEQAIGDDIIYFK